MTNIRLFSAVFLLFIGLSSINAQGGIWTWMSGSDTPNTPGNYGVKGVSSPDNEPPGRYQAAHWKDKDGNFWMFGGLETEYFNVRNDLWKFDPETAEWTWMHGPNFPNAEAVYGEKGVPSAQNLPPATSFGSLCWYDGDDGLYLYGGASFGFATNVWKYSIAMNEWVWLTGSEMIQDVQVSGIKGVPSPENTPGLRAENETCWTYNNKLWFACGQDLNFSSSSTWNFDLNTLEWTWMHGPLEPDLDGVIGIEGVFDEENYPGGRLTWSKWSDEGNAYLFSGAAKNDLWHFNSDSVAWRFLGEGNGSPFWEDFCVINEETQPTVSPEMQTADVIDDCRKVLWLFGGFVDQALWAYELNEDDWILVWGKPNAQIEVDYGIKGVPSLDNTIELRVGGCMWSDNDGNLWIYGGSSNSGALSDMWRFEPDYSCLNLSDSSDCCELMVSFRISHTMDSSGSVEIQVLDGEGVIEYSIDGGVTWSTENFFGDLPPGDYDVIVRDENGCTYTGTITVLDISVGTTNLADVDVSFSPNPVTDILKIQIDQLPSYAEKVHIRVIDMNGAILIRSTAVVINSILNTKLSFADLSKGNYFIQILINDKYVLHQISKS